MSTALILLAALANDKEADEAIARFKTAYATNSPTARAAAVFELGRVQHEKVLARLAGCLAQEAKEVKTAAARALGGFTEHKPKASAVLAASIAPNDKEPDVQVAIYESLGKLGDPSSLQVIHRGIQEKNPKAASAAILAAASYKNAAMIDAIMEEYEDADKVNKANTGGGGGVPGFGVPGGGGSDPGKDRAKEVAKACAKAMQSLSGDKYQTYGEWKIWWARRRATFGK